MRICCVVLPLAPTEVGTGIDRARWPGHVTLVGNMLTPQEAVDAAIGVVRRFAATTPPIDLLVGEEAMFGPDATVRVDLVQPGVLPVLHGRLPDALEQEGLRVEVPGWSRDGYRPHRTVTEGDRPARGEVLRARSVALVELDPPGAPGTGVVLDLRPLDG